MKPTSRAPSNAASPWGCRRMMSGLDAASAGQIKVRSMIRRHRATERGPAQTAVAAVVPAPPRPGSVSNQRLWHAKISRTEVDRTQVYVVIITRRNVADGRWPMMWPMADVVARG
eukprot:847403-Prymnesium_polylepis.1